MPVPKKPGELREMMRAKLRGPIGEMQSYVSRGNDAPGLEQIVDAAMSAIAEYDLPYFKAAELGEPTFTLRAQDRTAVLYVESWANNLYADCPGAADKCRSAIRIADFMRVWPHRKLPD